MISVGFGWERIEKYGWLCRWERSERSRNWPVDEQSELHDWMRNVHITYSDLILCVENLIFLPYFPFVKLTSAIAK